jgi:hypothetical protein
LTPSACKLNVKSKEEGFQTLSHSMPCWHINEKIYRLVDANTQKLLKLKEETSPLDIDHDKSYV